MRFPCLVPGARLTKVFTSDILKTSVTLLMQSGWSFCHEDLMRIIKKCGNSVLVNDGLHAVLLPCIHYPIGQDLDLVIQADLRL